MIPWTVAAAEEPAPAPAPEPAPEPAPIELFAPDDPLPSALDGLEGAHAEAPAGLSLDGLVPDWAPVAHLRVRGNVFVKPLAQALVAPGEPFAVRLGAAGGHRWWTFRPAPPSVDARRLVDVGGEERLTLSAPVGGARGVALGASVVAGPWLGPVGLRLGPSLRHDHLDWRPTELPAATAAGAVADLSLLAGKLVVTGGVEPMWLVGGDRRPADDALPGDEWSWRAGVGWLGRPLQWTIDGEARSTVIGTVWSGGLSLQLRVL